LAETETKPHKINDKINIRYLETHRVIKNIDKK